MSAVIPTYHLRARIAGLSRDRAAKDPELLDARAQLAVQNIINFVNKTLEKAPPISAEQRQRITALFEAGENEGRTHPRPCSRGGCLDGDPVRRPRVGRAQADVRDAGDQLPGAIAQASGQVMGCCCAESNDCRRRQDVPDHGRRLRDDPPLARHYRREPCGRRRQAPADCLSARGPRCAPRLFQSSDRRACARDEPARCPARRARPDPVPPRPRRRRHQRRTNSSVDAGRIGQLVITVLDAYEQLLPIMFAQSGRDAITEQLSELVVGAVAPPAVPDDLGEDDLLRGARLIPGRGSR